MKNNSYKLFITAAITILISLLIPSTAYGTNQVEAGALAVRTDGQPENLFGAAGIFTTLSGILLFIVGALSVVMIVVGGLRYVLSGGKESSITSAKNTVLYAIIGLIISLLAYAIINFVITAFMPGAALGGTNI